MLDSVKTVMHHTNANAKRERGDFWTGSYPVPDSHMGAIRKQQKQVKLLVAITDNIRSCSNYYYKYLPWDALHSLELLPPGSHITSRLRSSMKVTHITSLVLPHVWHSLMHTYLKLNVLMANQVIQLLKMKEGLLVLDIKELFNLLLLILTFSHPALN